MNARQFDVFANPDPASAKTHPYLIVLQSDQLAGLNTRMVAPLVAPKAIPFFDRLMPVVQIAGKQYVVDPTNAAAVLTRVLKRRIVNLESERDRILAAIDLVFLGI